MSKLDELKKELCDNFYKKICEMNEDDFLEFMGEIEDISFSNSLLEKTICGAVPANYFSCKKCKKVYGKCRSEDDDAYDECKKRWKKYYQN